MQSGESAPKASVAALHGMAGTFRLRHDRITPHGRQTYTFTDYIQSEDYSPETLKSLQKLNSLRQALQST